MAAVCFGWATVWSTWKDKRMLTPKIWVLQLQVPFPRFSSPYWGEWIIFFTLQVRLAPASPFSQPCLSPTATKLPVTFPAATINLTGSPPPLLFLWCQFLAKTLAPTSAAALFARQFPLQLCSIARITQPPHAHRAGRACGRDTLSSWWAWPNVWMRIWKKSAFSHHVSLQSTGAGDEGGGQALTSSGSCLKNFQTHPIIECQGPQGSCHYFSNLYSFWLTAISPTEQFKAPRPSTIKAPDRQRSKTSQCHVCLRER